MDALKYDVSTRPGYQNMIDSLPPGYVIFGKGPIVGSIPPYPYARAKQMAKLLDSTTDIPMCNYESGEYYNTHRGCDDVLFWYGSGRCWIGREGQISISTSAIFALSECSRLFELVVSVYPHMRFHTTPTPNLLAEEF